MERKLRVPNRTQICAAQGLVSALERLGREVPSDVIRDAEWPIEDAAPYDDEKSASRGPVSSSSPSAHRAAAGTM